MRFHCARAVMHLVRRPICVHQVTYASSVFYEHRPRPYRDSSFSRGYGHGFSIPWGLSLKRFALCGPLDRFMTLYQMPVSYVSGMARTLGLLRTGALQQWSCGADCGPWGRSLRLAEFVNPSMKTAGFRHPDRKRAFHDELGLRPLSRRLQVLVHPKVLHAQEIFGTSFICGGPLCCRHYCLLSSFLIPYFSPGNVRKLWLGGTKGHSVVHCDRTGYASWHTSRMNSGCSKRHTILPIMSRKMCFSTRGSSSSS